MGRFTRSSNPATERGLATPVQPRETVVTRQRRDPLPAAIDGPPTLSFLIHGQGNPVPTLIALNAFRRSRGDEILVGSGEGDGAIASLVDHVVPGADLVNLACHAWGHVLVFVPTGALPPEDLAELVCRAGAQTRWGFFQRRSTTSWGSPEVFWDNHMAPRTAHWLESRVWFLRREGLAAWSENPGRKLKALRRALGPPARIAVGVEGG